MCTVRFKLYIIQVLFQFGNGMIFARTRKIPKMHALGNKLFTLAWHIGFWCLLFVNKDIKEAVIDIEIDSKNNDLQ